jgi:hypothetical protein
LKQLEANLKNSEDECISKAKEIETLQKEKLQLEHAKNKEIIHIQQDLEKHKDQS